MFLRSIYKNDHNKWTGVPSSAGRHSWTGVSIHFPCLVTSYYFWGFFPLTNASDYSVFSCFCQDEYSIFPQTYSIDINGYILVYSVTSNKRFVLTRCRMKTAILSTRCWVSVHAPLSSSFEVVQVIHEKLLDMVGKVQWVHSSCCAQKTQDRVRSINN